MCQEGGTKVSSDENSSNVATSSNPTRTRRTKRDRDGRFVLRKSTTTSKQRKTKKQSRALQKHGKNAPSGGIESMLPSFIGVAILVCAVMAQQGFRGRATVAGIDLGTTNSVICVQAPSKGVGEIDCIRDPMTGSPIVVRKKVASLGIVEFAASTDDSFLGLLPKALCRIVSRAS